MGIYGQVMFLYGMTFLISMFVALIIWVFAKIIDRANNGASLFGRKEQN